MTQVKKNDQDSVEVKKLPQSEVKLLCKVPAKRLEKSIQKTAKELSKKIKVDGFRSGKIPFDVVERNVGQDKLLNESAEKLVKEVYTNAIIDKKIEAVGQPKIEIKKIAKGNDFEFEAIVACLPEIKIGEWVSDAKKINKEYKDKKSEVKDEEIQRELDFLANQRAKIVTVDRIAKEGDQVEVNFQVFKDNVAIEGGSADKHPVVIGKGNFIPGFEEKLIGMKAGEEKEFELTFPKDYHQKNLAGQKTLFKIKVNLVQERDLPKIDDEFASGIGKFKSLAELKKNLNDGLKKEKEDKTRREQELKIMDKIIEKTEAELPEVLIASEVEKMMSELNNDVARMGLNKQQYFDQLKTTEEDLKKQWKEKEAPKRVKAALILRDIAKEEEIAVNAKEIEEQMNRVIQYYKTINQAEKDIDTKVLYENIKAELTNKAVLDYLIAL